MFWLMAVLLTLSAAQGTLLSRQRRIAGGSHQTVEKAPWQVVFQTYRIPLCGGIILSESYILTSASCIEKQDINEVNVLSGTDQLNDEETRTNISSIEVHPNFNGKDNDLAVVKLESKLNITEKQKPANLTSFEPKIFEETARFSGFGFTNDGFPTTPIPFDMRTINLTIWPTSLCSYFLNDFSKKSSIICAGINKGPCHGDQGGPLVYNDNVIGVAINTNCYTDKPALFVKVDANKEFIDTATNGQAVWV